MVVRPLRSTAIFTVLFPENHKLGSGSADFIAYAPTMDLGLFDKGKRNCRRAMASAISPGNGQAPAAWPLRAGLS